MDDLIPTERIENIVYLIREQKVALDRDLARLYGVETYNLNKAVKRNRFRFPKDFMFQLTKEEYRALRFQTGMLKRGEHSKYLPFAFTEQGIAMLSSVLHSKRAVLVNIAIMRVFVRLRRLLETNRKLAEKIAGLEDKYEKLDGDVKAVFDIIRQIVNPPVKPIQKIGFLADQK